MTLLACQAQCHRIFEDDEIDEACAKEDFGGADSHAGADAEAYGVNEHRLCEGPLGQLLDRLPSRIEANPPVRNYINSISCSLPNKSFSSVYSYAFYILIPTSDCIFELNNIFYTQPIDVIPGDAAGHLTSALTCTRG